MLALLVVRRVSLTRGAYRETGESLPLLTKPGGENLHGS